MFLPLPLLSFLPPLLLLLVVPMLLLLPRLPLAVLRMPPVLARLIKERPRGVVRMCVFLAIISADGDRET